MTNRGLDRCPVSNYDLTGLPLEHRCPECGFAYDEHTQVWRISLLTWRFGRALALGLLCFFLLAQTLLFLKRGSQSWTPATLMMFAYIAILALSLRHTYSGRRTKWFVCTAPKGVMLRLRGRGLVVVPWDEVGKVVIRLGVPAKAVFLATTAGVKHRLEWFISGKQRTHDFERSIAEGKRRYLSRAAAASVESDE